MDTSQIQNTRDGVTWTVLEDRFTQRYSRCSYRKFLSGVFSEVIHKTYESRDKCLEITLNSDDAAYRDRWVFTRAILEGFHFH